LKKNKTKKNKKMVKTVKALVIKNKPAAVLTYANNVFQNIILDTRQENFRQKS